MICTLAAALMTGAGCLGQEQPKVSAEPSRVLIAYYSWGGNTKYAAAQIQRATGGTLFEIKPVKPYPSEYRECTVRGQEGDSGRGSAGTGRQSRGYGQV